jgi:uncharacterized membrane protein YfcA
MNSELTWIDQIVVPIFLIWFIGLILVFFRKNLDLHWKFSFLFIFVIYIIVFGKEWSQALDRLEANPGWEVRNWIYGLGKALFYFLFILWPISLVRMFYSTSRELVVLTSNILVTVTISYWFLFWLYFQFQSEIDQFFMTRFMELF